MISWKEAEIVAVIKEMSGIVENFTRNKFIHLIKARIKILYILIIIFVIISSEGCAVIKYFNEPKGFHRFTSDARIFYETRAEARAKVIAESLNQAIKVIEKKQYRPFSTKIRIYVFSNLKNFEKHDPSKNSAGVTFGGRFMILSPKKSNTLDRLPRVLTHELSHYQLFGYTGVIKAVVLPVWFKEGLAVWASDGGGAENVTEEEAKQALLSGLKFNPIYHEPILWGRKSCSKNMETHMFYRQSSMFIQYLYQKDEKHFKKMLNLVQEKGNLKYAIKSAYHQSLNLLWSGFLKSLK